MPTLWMIVIIATCVVILFMMALQLLMLRALGELKQVVIPGHRTVKYADLAGQAVAVGESAPSFTATLQQGKKIHLEDFQGYRILAFVEPGCSACEGAIKALNDLMQERPEFTVLAIGGIDLALNCSYAVEHDAHMHMLTPDLDVGENLYHVPMVPFVFIINEKGIIQARGVVNDSEHLQMLLASVPVVTAASTSDPLLITQLQ